MTLTFSDIDAVAACLRENYDDPLALLVEVAERAGDAGADGLAGWLRRFRAECPREYAELAARLAAD